MRWLATLPEFLIKASNILITLQCITLIEHPVIEMLNKNTLGVKSVGPIRSPTYLQPKVLISAEAKKSPIKDVSNDIP